MEIPAAGVQASTATPSTTTVDRRTERELPGDQPGAVVGQGAPAPARPDPRPDPAAADRRAGGLDVAGTEPEIVRSDPVSTTTNHAGSVHAGYRSSIAATGIGLAPGSLVDARS